MITMFSLDPWDDEPEPDYERKPRSPCLSCGLIVIALVILLVSLWAVSFAHAIEPPTKPQPGDIIDRGDHLEVVCKDGRRGSYERTPGPFIDPCTGNILDHSTGGSGDPQHIPLTVGTWTTTVMDAAHSWYTIAGMTAPPKENELYVYRQRRDANIFGACCLFVVLATIVGLELRARKLRGATPVVRIGKWLCRIGWHKTYYSTRYGVGSIEICDRPGCSYRKQLWGKAPDDVRQ